MNNYKFTYFVDQYGDFSHETEPDVNQRRIEVFCPSAVFVGYLAGIAVGTELFSWGGTLEGSSAVLEVNGVNSPHYMSMELFDKYIWSEMDPSDAEVEGLLHDHVLYWPDINFFGVSCPREEVGDFIKAFESFGHQIKDHALAHEYWDL